MRGQGIKDILGREICEGDILRVYHLVTRHNHPPKAKWDELCECPTKGEAFFVEVILSNDCLLIKYKDGSKYDIDFVIHRGYEIVGNIRENKELLNG